MGRREGRAPNSLLDEPGAAEQRMCGLCEHWSNGFCELRRQPVAASAAFAQRCNFFEAGGGGKGKVAERGQPAAVELPPIAEKLRAESAAREGPRLEVEPRLKRELRETALLFYRAGFNVVPVGPDKRPVTKTWSAEKRLSWEEVEEGLRRATGIAIVGGSEHPLKGAAVLVLIDVDKPSLLERSPTLRSIANGTVCYRTGPRCPRCEGKQLDVLEPGRRFRCKECGSEFTAEEAKRGFGIMVFIEASAAEKYGLTGTRRKAGVVEFLVKNGQVVPPSLHPSGLRYEWIRPPTEEDATLGIASLIEQDLAALAKELGLAAVEAAPEAAAAGGGRAWAVAPRLRELSEGRVSRVVELLKPYYRPGCRHNLLMALSGEAARKRVSPASVARIVKLLHSETRDEDSLKERLGTITYTYEKLGLPVDASAIRAAAGVDPPMPSEAVLRGAGQARVTGAPSLKAIVAAVAGEEEAERVVKELRRLLGRPPRRIVLERVLVKASKGTPPQLVVKDSLVVYDEGGRYRVYRERQLATGTSRSLFAVLPEVVEFADTSTGNTFYIAREDGRVVAIAGSLEGLLPMLVNAGYIVAPSISSIAVQLLIDAVRERERGELSPGFGEEGFVDPYGLGFDLTDYGVEGLLSVREWIKKYYPESNRAAALANVAILVAKLLSPAVRKRNHTFIDTIIWNYGRGGEGKTTLAAYAMLPLLGVSPNDERLIVFMRGAVETTAQMAFLIAVNRLPLILDEQTMRNLERNADIMLSAAVGQGVIKIHAPRYGYTGEVRFKNQRGLIVFTNVPFSQWLRRVRAQATDYAFARRFLEVQWENEAVSKEAFADLPRVKPILGSVERVWLERREELAQSRDAVDLARRLIRALSEAYGADLSDYLAALDEVEARWLGALSQVKATDVDLLRERAYEIARQQLGASQLTAARVVESMLSNPDYYGIKLYAPKRVKDREEELAELSKVKAELMVMQGDDAQRLAKLLEDLEARGTTRVVIRARSQLVPGEPREFLGARVSAYTFKQGDKSEVVNGYSVKVKQLLEVFGLVKRAEEVDEADGQQPAGSTTA